MDKEKLIEIFKSLPKWAQITIVTLILAATCIGLVSLPSCGTTYRVTQSSYNTSTGDSIVIRYESYGNLKKIQE